MMALRSTPYSYGSVILLSRPAERDSSCGHEDVTMVKTGHGIEYIPTIRSINDEDTAALQNNSLQPNLARGPLNAHHLMSTIPCQA